MEEQHLVTASNEADAIFSLLAYSIVYRDWQPQTVPRPERRGYNIGAVLVNPANEPVSFGLNCINSTDDCTQHGELRAITSHLKKNGGFNLEGFTLYATLEPCIMCAGMITMTSIRRVVYGQHDVDYSKAFERLALDTRSMGGFPPYPRPVAVEPSSLRFCAELDAAYQQFLQTETEKMLARFLSFPSAAAIFKQAEEAFLEYAVSYPDNEIIYENARRFYTLVKQA